MRPHLRTIAVAALAGLAVSSASAQQVPAPEIAPPSPEMMAEMRAAEARYHAMPDTPGTGAFPAIKEEVASLPGHVVYRPANLAALGSTKLPLLVWGNGGCASDGASSRLHLLEIASHGYLAIANGTIKSGPGAPPQPPKPDFVPPKPGEPFTPPPPETEASQLVQAIDWAVAENARPGSPFFGKIDTDRVAVSGWSCGGIQALRIAGTEPRVKAVIIHNSGIFINPRPLPGMDLRKDALAKLRTPVLYVLGGPKDIAYANGMDDIAHIDHVPAVVLNREVGHGGTFYEPNGGAAAQVAVAWLDWQLKGDAKAKRWFAGKDCTLCTDPSWKIDRKGLD